VRQSRVLCSYSHHFFIKNLLFGCALMSLARRHTIYIYIYIYIIILGIVLNLARHSSQCLHIARPDPRPDPTNRISQTLCSLSLRDAFVFVCRVLKYASGYLEQMGEYFEITSPFLLVFSLILHNSSIDRVQRHTRAHARAYILSLSSSPRTLSLTRSPSPRLPSLPFFPPSLPPSP